MFVYQRLQLDSLNIMNQPPTSCWTLQLKASFMSVLFYQNRHDSQSAGVCDKKQVCHEFRKRFSVCSCKLHPRVCLLMFGVLLRAHFRVAAVSVYHIQAWHNYCIVWVVFCVSVWMKAFLQTVVFTKKKTVLQRQCSHVDIYCILKQACKNYHLGACLMFMMSIIFATWDYK